MSPLSASACRYADQYANDIADLLAPQSGAYYDVWLDGEKFFAHTMEVRAAAAEASYRCCRRLVQLPLASSTQSYLLPAQGGTTLEATALVCPPHLAPGAEPQGH
jgi:hypothetical protein